MYRTVISICSCVVPIVLNKSCVFYTVFILYVFCSLLFYSVLKLLCELFMLQSLQ